MEFKAVAKIPIQPAIASIADTGMIELFEGDWLEGMVDVLEQS